MDNYKNEDFEILPEKLKICLPDKKGKALAVNSNGEITCNAKKNKNQDDEWIFTEVKLPSQEKGYHIVSANSQMVMHYNPKDGEQISTVPYLGQNHTIWVINKDNEIYTISPKNGEKMYLWSILGNLYVTHDEYLSEKFSIVDLKGKTAQITETEKVDILIPLLILLILIMIIWVIYFRKS